MKTLEIYPGHVLIDGVPLELSCEDDVNFFTALYKSLGISYPKFYKMDPLCKLGFLGAEILLGSQAVDPDTSHEDHAMVVIGACRLDSR